MKPTMEDKVEKARASLDANDAWLRVDEDIREGMELGTISSQADAALRECLPIMLPEKE